MERAAAILFARSDARARAAGWEVAGAGRWNTSRVYRDPRYDRLRARAAPDRAQPDPHRAWARPDQAWAGRERARSRR